MTTSNTWAAAADVLKADDAAIYNISFLGTKPANTTAAAASLYGKYLIPTYGAAAFGAAVAAPGRCRCKCSVGSVGCFCC